MAEILDTVLIVVHVMLVVALIGLILLQKSEGGALGIGGGGGGGGGFMSARGAADALTKTTTIVAAAFFATSILLGVSAKQQSGTDTLIDRIQNTQTGVPSEGGDVPADTPSAGSLLEDLQKEGPQEDTGVPTGN